MGTRQMEMKKSFKVCIIRSLLNPCSKQKFSQAFSGFTTTEQEFLHKLLIQVVTALQEHAEKDFQSICDERKVETALETVEQLLEEQALDPLFLDKTSVMHVARDLSTTQKDEMQYLITMLAMVEEENHPRRDRIEHLKKERVDMSGMENALEKLRSGSLTYGKYISNDAQIRDL